ncbi:MAG: gephyrin-like molybdotransferase Glp [Pseudomonadota bacterium]
MPPKNGSESAPPEKHETDSVGKAVVPVPSLLSVDEALQRILDMAEPVGSETVSLAHADGRALRDPVIARRTQPPFDASAMDGYAVRAVEANLGSRLLVMGEIPAGAMPGHGIGHKEAMRIFTGAPMPVGADAILLQEDAAPDVSRKGALERLLGVTVRAGVVQGDWVRPAGGDFHEGDVLIDVPRRLRPQDIGLAAAAGVPWLTVARKPRVALIATGDELKLPGEPTEPSEIASSNNFSVAALLARYGAEPVILPIAHDDVGALRAAIREARGADLIVTLGGASVGDHDFSRRAFEEEGMSPDFYKIAMRPGKPLMAGHLGDALVVGLPGNPVSAFVCAHVFLRPALDALLGLPAEQLMRRPVPLAIDLPPGGPREHYMRAALERREVGPVVRPEANQDSSLMSILAQADVLAVRPAHDRARQAGEMLDCIDL